MKKWMPAFSLALVFFSCSPLLEDISGDLAELTDASLVSLTLQGVAIEPEFEPTRLVYAATVGSATDTVVASATKARAEALIELRMAGSAWSELPSGSPSAPQPLDTGDNLLEIRVTAPDGKTTKIYALTVRRQSPDAELSTLVPTTGSLVPPFAPNTYAYGLEAPATLAAIAFTPTCAHPGASIEVSVNGGAGFATASGVPTAELPLDVGDTVVTIRVTAEDESIPPVEYVVQVHRLSDEAALSALVPASGTLAPVFETATTAYSLLVSSATSSVEITATASYALANIEARTVDSSDWTPVESGAPFASGSLLTGDNDLAIRVVSEDGLVIREYEVTIHRPSGDATLSGLALSAGGLAPAFASGTTSYTVFAPSTTTGATVTPSTTDAAATVQVRVNSGPWQGVASGSPSSMLPMVPGSNPVEVLVTAEDQAVTRTYTVYVDRACAGTLDTGFATTGSGFDSGLTDLAVAADGKLLVSGYFATYDGTSAFRFTRLNADGGRDATFNPGGAGANNYVNAIVPLADGKILIGGQFTTYNGTNRGRVARLSADGTLDTSFNPGTGADGYLASLAVQADGKVLIGGNFQYYNGTARMHLARINANGTLDATFSVGTGTNGSAVLAVATQADGKILIGGDFTTYNGSAAGYLARLNADGSLDTSFLSGLPGANGTVYAIAVQSDGKILVGGNFTSFNSVAAGRLVRLNTDGSLDAVFDAGSGANGLVLALAVDSSGRILACGDFTGFDGIPRGRIVRLLSSGALAASFVPAGTGASATVSGLSLAADGRILICGTATTWNGYPIDFIARILAASP